MPRLGVDLVFTPFADFAEGGLTLVGKRKTRSECRALRVLPSLECDAVEIGKREQRLIGALLAPRDVVVAARCGLVVGSNVVCSPRVSDALGFGVGRRGRGAGAPRRPMVTAPRTKAGQSNAGHQTPDERL